MISRPPTVSGLVTASRPGRLAAPPACPACPTWGPVRMAPTLAESHKSTPSPTPNLPSLSLPAVGAGAHAALADCVAGVVRSTLAFANHKPPGTRLISLFESILAYQTQWGWPGPLAKGPRSPALSVPPPSLFLFSNPVAPMGDQMVVHLGARSSEVISAVCVRVCVCQMSAVSSSARPVACCSVAWRSVWQGA